jgi:hypothetical protein
LLYRYLKYTLTVDICGWKLLPFSHLILLALRAPLPYSSNLLDVKVVGIAL